MIPGKDPGAQLDGGHDHRQRRQLHQADQGTERQLRADLAEGQGALVAGEMHYRCWYESAVYPPQKNHFRSIAAAIRSGHASNLITNQQHNYNFFEDGSPHPNAPSVAAVCSSCSERLRNMINLKR